MYGNEGECWIMVKALSLNGLCIDKVGEVFQIGPYYSVPHGFVSINCEGLLLFMPDGVFEEHFVKRSIYEQYYRLGDIIKINANGNLGAYSIEDITGDGHYVTLKLEQN